MTVSRSFKDVKFQWLSLICQDNRLSPTAITVAVYIVTTHYNPEKECAWPSFKTIANAIHKNVKTVQRAIKELEIHWFDVKRGNGHGHSTTFAPSIPSVEQAITLREKQDKVVTLQPKKGRHICPKRVTNLSDQGRQNCPPNKEIESRNKKIEQPPSPNLKPFPKIFVETQSLQFQSWQAWLKDRQLPPLDELRPKTLRYGATGYYLPSAYPPSTTTESDDMENFLRTRSKCYAETHTTPPSHTVKGIACNGH